MAPPQPFEFITVSGKNIKGDAVTRKRVRSRAQADYRRRNPPPPKAPLRADLDVAEWLRALSHDTAKQYSRAGNKVKRKLSACTDGSISQSPSPFERSGSDVFQLMTSSERQRAQALWQHLYAGTCVVFKSMVEIGFLDLLHGSAALTQMLSSSAWHMNNEADESNGSKMEYARYSVMATNSLRHALTEPTKRLTIETIVAILTFAAYANLTSETNLINIHLDGLCHALSSVGGLHAIDNLPIIRTMIYWIDLRASFLQDVAPRFPQPFAIIAQRTEAIPRDATEDLSLLPDDFHILYICENIKQVNILIKRHLATESYNFWENVLFPQFHLAPILHDLLSMPRVTAQDDTAAQCRELFRLSAILYLRQLWAGFGMDKTGEAQYVSKLHRLWSQYDFAAVWVFEDSLLLWSSAILVVCRVAPDGMQSDVEPQVQNRLGCRGKTVNNDLACTGASQLWCEPALGSLDSILDLDWLTEKEAAQ